METTQKITQKIQENNRGIKWYTGKDGIPSFLVITLTVSGLNSLKDRDWQTRFIKHDPTICCLQETCYRFKITMISKKM